MLRKIYVCLMFLMLTPAGAVGQQEEFSQDIGKTNSPCGGGHLHQCPENGESQKLHSDPSPSPDSWKQGDVRDEAVSMYLKMAEHNNCDAQFLMCRIYREGERIPKDLSKAIFWCSEAGRQECLSSTGGPAAALMLEILYHYGEEVEALVDVQKAFFGYSRVLQGEEVPQV